MNYKDKLARALRYLRMSEGLTRDVVAARSGMTYSTIADLETGNNRNIDRYQQVCDQVFPTANLMLVAVDLTEEEYAEVCDRDFLKPSEKHILELLDEYPFWWDGAHIQSEGDFLPGTLKASLHSLVRRGFITAGKQGNEDLFCINDDGTRALLELRND